MKKKFAIYTQDQEGVQHTVITNLTANEAASYVKLLLDKMDLNKPVDLSIHPYIDLGE